MGSYVLNATYIYAHLRAEFWRMFLVGHLPILQVQFEQSNSLSFWFFWRMVHVSNCELPHLRIFSGVLKKVGKLVSIVNSKWLTSTAHLNDLPSTRKRHWKLNNTTWVTYTAQLHGLPPCFLAYKTKKLTSLIFLTPYYCKQSTKYVMNTTKCYIFCEPLDHQGHEQ